MSDFISLHTALSGLHAAQTGMDTVSDNIANVNTPGYTRRRVELRTRYPWESIGGRIGSGVDIVDITRARDAFLDARVRAVAAADGRVSIRTGILQRIEAGLAEPDAGISTALGDLWSNFENVALDPPNTAARLQTLQSLQTLASRIRSVAASWETVAADSAAGLTSAVDEANALLHEVARLNAQILESGADFGSPNDLLDQRDLALDRLAELAGVTVTEAGHGLVRVSLSGLALVDGTYVSELAVDDATGDVLHPSGGLVAASGEVGGHQGVLQSDIPAYRVQLDAFAADLADALNAQHASGFSASGPGGPLLTYTPGNAAATLDVAISDPADLATSTDPGPPYPVFNGGNAEALAALRGELVAGGGADTLEASVRALVATVGSETASALASTQSQAALRSSAEFARTGEHGVSLDEEMVALINYQRSYEAAARLMTAVDEALDTLIRRTGIVGR